MHSNPFKVVAGTNYRFEFTAGCSGIEDGASVHCSELTIHEPLPHACRSNGLSGFNPRCLSLSDEDIAARCDLAVPMLQVPCEGGCYY